MKTASKIDKSFLFTTLALTFFGLIIFISSSHSLLGKDSAAYSSILMNHIGFGLVFGSIAAFLASIIPYRFWSVSAFWMYIIGILLILSVFIPGLGMDLGGAKRWINVFGLSFQPVEFMKIAYILFLSSWFYAIKDKVTDFKKGLVAFVVISFIPAAILIAQPDIDNTMIMLATGGVIYFLAGARIKHILILISLGLLVAVLAVSIHPYAKKRIETFFKPHLNQETTGYQVKQSIIAIGAGEIFGKGLGQSIQKYKYLPEPMSDSVFAVLGEEFGFVGSVLLIILYILFLIFGIKIGIKSRDLFGRLTAIGIVILIVSQSFLNIASMLGLFPLSGLPLLFISQGGTALFITLFAVGIVINISKFQIKKS